MISGGQHKNIFSVNLGQITLDRDIKRLVEEITVLQKGLADLIDGQNGEKDHNLVVKEISKAETEIEILKQKLIENER